MIGTVPQLTRPGEFVPTEVRENRMEEDKTDADKSLHSHTGLTGRRFVKGGLTDDPNRHPEFQLRSGQLHSFQERG